MGEKFVFVTWWEVNTITINTNINNKNKNNKNNNTFMVNILH